MERRSGGRDGRCGCRCRSGGVAVRGATKPRSSSSDTISSSPGTTMHAAAAAGGGGGCWKGAAKRADAPWRAVCSPPPSSPDRSSMPGMSTSAAAHGGSGADAGAAHAGFVGTAAAPTGDLRCPVAASAVAEAGARGATTAGGSAAWRGGGASNAAPRATAAARAAPPPAAHPTTQTGLRAVRLSRARAFAEGGGGRRRDGSSCRGRRRHGVSVATTAGVRLGAGCEGAARHERPKRRVHVPFVFRRHVAAVVPQRSLNVKCDEGSVGQRAAVHRAVWRGDERLHARPHQLNLGRLRRHGFGRSHRRSPRGRRDGNRWLGCNCVPLDSGSSVAALPVGVQRPRLLQLQQAPAHGLGRGFVVARDAEAAHRVHFIKGGSRCGCDARQRPAGQEQIVHARRNGVARVQFDLLTPRRLGRSGAGAGVISRGCQRRVDRAGPQPLLQRLSAPLLCLARRVDVVVFARR